MLSRAHHIRCLRPKIVEYVCFKLEMLRLMWNWGLMHSWCNPSLLPNLFTQKLHLLKAFQLQVSSTVRFSFSLVSVDRLHSTRILYILLYFQGKLFSYFSCFLRFSSLQSLNYFQFKYLDLFHLHFSVRALMQFSSFPIEHNKRFRLHGAYPLQCRPLHHLPPLILLLCLVLLLPKMHLESICVIR